MVEEAEYQTYNPPNGSTEVVITFPDGWRYVKDAEVFFTPTLVNGGAPGPNDSGDFYLMTTDKGFCKSPVLHIFPNGQDHIAVKAGVDYHFIIPLNKDLKMIKFNVRRNQIQTQMNGIKVILSKG